MLYKSKVYREIFVLWTIIAWISSGLFTAEAHRENESSFIEDIELPLQLRVSPSLIPSYISYTPVWNPPPEYLNYSELPPGEQIANCQTALKELILDPTAPPLLNLITYSGKSPSEVGDYLGCSALRDSRYVGMFYPPLFLGLCGPKNCTSFGWMVVAGPYIKKLVDKIMEARGMTPSAMQMPTPIFRDVKESNQEYRVFGVGAGVLLTLLTILILFSILSGIYDMYILKGENPRDNKVIEFIMYFSLTRNAKALFYSKNHIDPNLDIFHGIRFLSISWVVLGNSYMFIEKMPLLNISGLLQEAKDSFWFSIITGATVSVDIFFMLSGFFSIIGVTRGFARLPTSALGKGVGVLKCYIHRYLRLLPIYAVVICVQIYFMSLFADGPISYFQHSMTKNCKDKWYYNLIYGNNMITAMTSCNGWTWYLANDMQMFLLIPFLVLIYKYKPLLGVITVGILSLISSSIQIALISTHDWQENMLTPNEDMNGDYYVKPWCRINPYLIGVLMAWVYNAYKDSERDQKKELERLKHARENLEVDEIVPVVEDRKPLPYPLLFVALSNKVKTSNSLRYTFYTIGFTLNFCSIFVCYPFYHYTIDSKALNLLVIWLRRPCFALGLALIIFPVLVDRGRIIHAILGAPFMLPLGRMSYGVYLMHVSILYAMMGVLQVSPFYSAHMVVLWAIRIEFIAYLSSIMLTLFIESPFLKLETWLMTCGWRHKKKKG